VRKYLQSTHLIMVEYLQYTRNSDNQCKETNNTMWKWATALNRHMSNGDTRMPNRCVENAPHPWSSGDWKLKLQSVIITNLLGCLISKMRWKWTITHCWSKCRLAQFLWKKAWNFIKILKNRMITELLTLSLHVNPK
jgi:hypothetical protein